MSCSALATQRVPLTSADAEMSAAFMTCRCLTGFVGAWKMGSGAALYMSARLCGVLKEAVNQNVEAPISCFEV